MTREPRRNNPAARKVLIGVIVVALVVAAFGIGLLVSHSRNKKTTETSQPPTGGALSFPTFASKMGLTTGVQLWNSSPSDTDAEIKGIGDAGAHWLRTAVRWKDVEPSSADQDDWTQADRIVDDAEQAHLSLIFNITGAPDWAGAKESGEFSTDPQQYADFVAKLAARYKGKVSVFELGNEPNLTNEVPHPDAATYAKILEAAYPAIKRANPDAFVLTAGLAGGRSRKGNMTGDDYLTQLYQNGAKGFFDGIAFHPYTYPQLPTQEAKGGGRNWSMMLRVRNLMVANGDGDKQIWVTEFGAPTNGPNSVSEQEQASIMKDGFDLWKTYSWGGVISWFDYQDKGTDTSTHKDFFGIVDTTGAHKPSYATYSDLAHG